MMIISRGIFIDFIQNVTQNEVILKYSYFNSENVLIFYIFFAIKCRIFRKQNFYIFDKTF